MISKESVYNYLSEGLVSEGWFNFKEDEPDQNNQSDDDNQQNITSDKSNPNLDWHFRKDVMILFSGSSSETHSQYYPFADEIRYADFDSKKDKKDKNSKDDKGVFTKDFKTGARNFGLALISGGLAATVDAADKAFSDKIDKDKKDKNGNTDKWADAVIKSFTNLNDFKKHAEKNHVPSSLIDDFINTYQQAKANVAGNNK